MKVTWIKTPAEVKGYPDAFWVRTSDEVKISPNGRKYLFKIFCHMGQEPEKIQLVLVESLRTLTVLDVPEGATPPGSCHEPFTPFVFNQQMLDIFKSEDFGLEGYGSSMEDLVMDRAFVLSVAERAIRRSANRRRAEALRVLLDAGLEL